jgi:excisionase family DNA binding protein
MRIINMKLTTTQAAAKLGVHRSRVWQLIKAGRLPAQKIGRDWFIEEQDLKLVAGRKPGRPKGVITMKKEERENDAVSILHRRYIGDDAERKASLQEERVNAEVARMIYDLRKGAGLTQKEGTTGKGVFYRIAKGAPKGHKGHGD